MSFITQPHEDSEKGGLYHVMSEDFARVIDSDKHAEDQFNEARISVIGAMISHDPGSIAEAEQAVERVIARFEDKTHGGYFAKTDRQWRIIDRHKSLRATDGIFGILMHLYEVSKKDTCLLKAFDFLDCAVTRAWDDGHGGFYPQLTEDLQPADENKLLETQLACLMALNVACRLSGFKRYKRKISALVKIIEERCFDEQNSGVYASYARDWQPLARDKVCGPNLLVNGILSMLAPIVNNIDVTRNTLRLWIEPAACSVSPCASAHVSVSVQNQGFSPVPVRVGGLSTPTRWMDPPKMRMDLDPHESKTCRFRITPPADMPAGTYYFELTASPAGEVFEYAAAGGKVIIG